MKIEEKKKENKKIQKIELKNNKFKSKFQIKGIESQSNENFN
jgi:hypothetical protein